MTRGQANILLVDDRPENLLALEAILEPLGENLVRVESGEAALRAMLQQEFAVILLDVQMPGMDGYETAALIKARERTRHVPIIFLTAIDTDDRAARRGYGAGAVDYLFKPFDAVVLRSKVSVFIDLFHLKREAEELAHRALHDPLTGLANRVLFHDRLELALARTSRLPSSVGVFYIDLDGFKPINDTLGHEAGDLLLIEIAQRLRQVLRPADTVARLGGDEFALLSDAIGGQTGAGEIADRVLAAIAAPYDLAGRPAEVSASIGIALAGDPTDPIALLRGADEAMYVAKAAGGSQWSLYDPARRGGPVGVDIELVPRAALTDDAVAGWGVLVSGRDGATTQVDDLERPAAADLLAAAMRAAGGAPVSVPIAPALIGDLVPTVHALLRETGMDPGSLCLEVPDSVLRQPAASTLRALTGVSGLGVRLAVRGVGSGATTLATLADLELSALLLDPELDESAARAAVAVARSLGVAAVAIDVDQPERLDAVRALGFDVAQGAACGAPSLTPRSA